MKIFKILFLLFFITSFQSEAQITGFAKKVGKKLFGKTAKETVKRGSKRATKRIAKNAFKKKISKEAVNNSSAKVLKTSIKKTSKIGSRKIAKTTYKKGSKIDLKKWATNNKFQLTQTKRKGVFKIKDKSGRNLGQVFKKGNKTTITADETILLKNKIQKVNPILEDVLPNTNYKINNSIFKTDHLGRTVSAKITSIPKNILDRTKIKGTNEQAKAISKGGIKGLDDGGHMIGHNLGGNSGALNIVAQSSKLNRGKFRVLEKFASKNKKYIKDYEVTSIYKGKKARPNEFVQKLKFYGKKDEILALKKKYPDLKYRKQKNGLGKSYYVCMFKHKN
ncbi:DNA/RNA non-specific endonuclease [Aureivirga sp. CE67]|uniref:DNA/RNA non-specific endonuclease n=1 Tax=Aureivirga sp. CE67 TaxID=1788983 RepID=UPI0018CB1E53|nr:DNA/RNA non-specific endonuclease [Aureivirga sp. CE67]